MRHQKKRDKLSRGSDQRSVLIKNTIRSFFASPNITISTTLIRAKVIRVFIEKIITMSKKASKGESDKLSVIRFLASYLGNMDLVNKVMEIGKNFENRHGGYTRVIKAGYRRGDNACVAYIQLVR